MRQIKFRGLDVENKHWLYGSLIVFKDGTHTIMHEEKDDKGFTSPVIPESVGQFTGIHDKNGTEIYEGDRVRHNNNIFVVKFSENQHVLLLRVENDKGINWRSLQWLTNVSKYCQVIGNIHTDTNSK